MALRSSSIKTFQICSGTPGQNGARFQYNCWKFGWGRRLSCRVRMYATTASVSSDTFCSGTRGCQPPLFGLVHLFRPCNRFFQKVLHRVWNGFIIILFHSVFGIHWFLSASGIEISDYARQNNPSTSKPFGTLVRAGHASEANLPRRGLADLSQFPFFLPENM